MRGDDPVRAERTFKGSEDGLTVVDAGGVQRHMHPLARVHERRSAGLLEQPLCILLVEVQRFLQSRHLALGRVSQGEPEQLVVGELLERATPVLDLLGLSLVEQEDREHPPLFPEPSPFPCAKEGPCSKPRVAHGPLAQYPSPTLVVTARLLGVCEASELAVGLHQLATLFGGHLFVGPGST